MIKPIKRNANNVCLSMYYLGTGSAPPLWKGWHLTTLLDSNKTPLSNPCLFIAPLPYSEQVGWNLHFAPNKGDMLSWYSLIRLIKILDNNLFIFIDALLCRQNLSAFFTPSWQNTLSTNARHSLAKTVLVLSFSFAWLISSLHYYLRNLPRKLLIFIVSTN